MRLSPIQTTALILIGIISVAGLTVSFTLIDYTRQTRRLILATTTSTYDSGLLDVLIPSFENIWGVPVDVIAVGTGQALANGMSGDCDVVLVHARDKEVQFVNEGYGIHRVTLMWNDFIIVGPLSDPANIEGLNNATEAFIRIYNAGEAGNATFYSRGDGSGTELKELSIWAQTGLPTPNSSANLWYKETGQGMSGTLTIANEQDGYTLTDRGTWLFRENSLTHISLKVENDTVLLNPYSAILVDPGRFPNVNFEMAVKFVAYLASPQIQQEIGNYKINGEVLFHPCYGQGNQTSLKFDTDEEVQTQVNYWDPIISMYYG